MTKEQLLIDLRDTYVQLRPSSIVGVGVFAIRDIPKGTRNMFSEDNGEWVRLSKEEVEQLPNYTREMIYNYCAFDDNNYYIEKYGFKKMDLANFVNHSEKPNIVSINGGKFFEAIIDIKAGEELFIDYGKL